MGGLAKKLPWNVDVYVHGYLGVSSSREKGQSRSRTEETERDMPKKFPML